MVCKVHSHCIKPSRFACGGPSAASYFSLTKSKTKIAHIPTVIGNCTNSASRTAFPLGSRKLSPNIAKAVSIPRANLFLEFMVSYLAFQARPGCNLDGGSLATSIIIAKSEECNSSFPAVSN